MNEYPTANELCDILGEHWAICRDSFENRCRYGRCITRKEYKAATKLALQRREAKGTAR